MIDEAVGGFGDDDMKQLTVLARTNNAAASPAITARQREQSNPSSDSVSGSNSGKRRRALSPPTPDQQHGVVSMELDVAMARVDKSPQTQTQTQSPPRKALRVGPAPVLRKWKDSSLVIVSLFLDKLHD